MSGDGDEVEATGMGSLPRRSIPEERSESRTSEGGA